MKFVVPACLLVGILIFDLSLFSQTQKSINISVDRPRLFVRADASSVGSGLTVTQLRERMKDTAYAQWSSYNAEPSGWESLPAIAMQYLLSGDKKYANTVAQYLTAKSFPLHEHTSTAAAVYYSAIAFDWVREALPQQMVDTITKHLSQGAEHLLEGVLQPAVNHNYTFVSMHGIAMAALAIYGEGDDNTRRALEYIGMVDNLVTGEGLLLDTFKEKRGIWGEGNHYTQFVVYYPLLMTLRALETATDAKYFDLVRNKYDNFLNPMAKFIVANFRPDFTMERTGDVTGRIVPVKSFLRPIIELLASEINAAELQGQLRSFSSALQEWYGPDLTSPVLGWMMMVTYNSQLPQAPSYKTLPLAMRLGEDAYEHFMFRNNWNKNGTLITYVTGDHYTDHQHLDKGNFLIYKNGGLAIDGGVYSRMYGDHWSNYSSRTIAHNNVLIHDTSELTGTDPGNTVVYPDGGQEIKRGLQSHSNWNHFEQLKKDSGLDAGSVVAYATDSINNIYNYVKSDLTTAYGNKSLWVDRQLLYVPGADYLIVRDRLITSKPAKKYWLLHFEGRPTVDAKTPAPGITNYKAANVVRVERVGDMNLGSNTIKYSGALFVKSLLPLQRNISVVGGSGFEYYNRFVNKNFPPDEPAPSAREAGNWRIEVSAATPSQNTIFMHALEITGASKRQMVPVTYIKSAEGKMDGAHFRTDSTNYLTMFSTSMDERGHSQQYAKLPVSYSLTTKGNTKHILAELQPGAKVKIMANNKSLGVFQVNDAGVLMFNDNGKGKRNVLLTKAGVQ